jgi:hypothetical protein
MGYIINPYSYATGSSFENLYSMDFDGVDDFLIISPSISLSGTFTLSAWINPPSISGSSCQIFNSATNNQNKIGVTSATQMGAKIGGTSVFFTESGGNDFVLNVWQHILIIRDSSNNITAFRNGASFGSSATNSNTATIDSIGKFNNVVFMNPKVDEVAIFDTDQTANVSTIYNSGVPADLSSLSPLHWYRMGDNGVYKSTQWLLPENSNKDKVSNYSFEFDGVDDVMTLDATFDATGGLTLSCWVKYTAASAGSLNWLCSNGGTGGSGSQFNIRLIADGRWFMYFNGSPQDTGLTGFNDGNWHHLAMTVNYSNGDVKFYKDGSESSTVLTWGSTYSTAILKNIGGANSTPAYPYGGFVDEFSVFESIVDIATLYNSGTPTTLPSGAVAHWKLGEDATFSTNWTVPDAVGSADATSANMTIEDRVGEAPNSTSNSLSYNMVEADRETDVPS